MSTLVKSIIFLALWLLDCLIMIYCIYKSRNTKRQKYFIVALIIMYIISTVLYYKIVGV